MVRYSADYKGETSRIFILKLIIIIIIKKPQYIHQLRKKREKQILCGREFSKYIHVGGGT